MHLYVNAVVLILGAVISQSVFAGGMLWFAPVNKRASRILAVLIISMALWLSDDFMRISQIYRQNPDLYFLPIFYSLGFGPLIWFYVRSLINHNFRFSGRHILHFIPVILQAGLYLYLSFCPYRVKQWYWLNIHQHITYRIEFDGTWVSLVIYLTLSFRLIRHYQVWVADNFSETSLIRLNWLRTILAVLLILCVQWFIEIILRDFYGTYFQYDYSIQLLGLVVLVLGVAGLRQSSLSIASYMPEAAVTPSKNIFEPDTKILEKINKAMITERLYLNPTLTLVELAAAVKLNTKVVSRHINTGYNKSFNDYVNGFRVEEVKMRLKSGDLERLTIMGIALDSGFNSKTTFNRIFKEFTGMAPTDFIK